MEQPDELEHKFRSSFSGFEQAPPEGAWEKLQCELNPKPRHENMWMRVAGSSVFHERQVRRYFAFAAAAIILFLTIVYIASADHHVVRGHAYAGEARLCRGLAVLFRVGDKVRPWDSVGHYRSAMIDDNGYYKFSRIEPGVYLLRIVPEESSDASKSFLPSWFDQHNDPDSSHIIIIGSEDVEADVHLLAKPCEKNP